MIATLFYLLDFIGCGIARLQMVIYCILFLHFSWLKLNDFLPSAAHTWPAFSWSPPTPSDPEGHGLFMQFSNFPNIGPQIKPKWKHTKCSKELGI